MKILILILLPCVSLGFEATDLYALNDMCEEQQSPWCEPLEGDIKSLSWRQAGQIYTQVKLAYQTDQDKYGLEDKWVDYSSYSEAYGDCEDFALTWGAIANQMGVDKSDITLVYVNTSQGPHMYVKILDWVFDNTQDRPSHTEKGEFFYSYNMGVK